MDPDHHGPTSIEGFNLILPLPYRVAVILVAGKKLQVELLLGSLKLISRFYIGVWGWGLNLHYLSLLKIVRDILSRSSQAPPVICY